MANQITIASVQMYVHQEQKKNLIQNEKHLKHIKTMTFHKVRILNFVLIIKKMVKETRIKIISKIPRIQRSQYRGELL